MELHCPSCDYIGPNFKRLYPGGLIFRCGDCGAELNLSGEQFAEQAMLAAARQMAGEGHRLHWGQIAKRARHNNPGARLIGTAYLKQPLISQIEAIYQAAIAP